MTRLDRYKAKLAEFEHKRNEFMRRGMYVQMQMLAADIDELKRLIKDAEPKPVTELFPKEKLRASGLVPAVLEVHLAADYLAACSYTVEDIVRKLGGEAVSVVPEIKEIINRTDKFCSFLYGMDEELRDMITEDESLMNALHKKTLSYIGQRMKNHDRKKEGANQ